MQKTIIFFLTVLLFSCSEECTTSQITESVILADVTDTPIVKNFLSEKELLCEKIFPFPLGRCEGIKITCIPIGATIENDFAECRYPRNGSVAGNTGNYDLEKINSEKMLAVNSFVDSSIRVFGNTISPQKSQIWHTIHTTLEKYKTAKQVIIATDLLDNNGKISFYKPFEPEKMLQDLKNEYQVKDLMSARGYKGRIIIISPLGTKQHLVLAARNFYKYYFSQLGIAESQLQFISSISQIK
jgi:hypothetical protein